MVWNKTPQHIVNSVLKALEDLSKSYGQIAKELEVSAWIVGDICRKHLSTDLKKLRYKIACSRGKRGAKNPMYGKTGFSHHNAQPGVRVMGYKTVFVPDWWIGKVVKSGRIYEHHYVWAKATGNTALPKGHVVHHIDGNIDNNCIENLTCLTISEHIKLHARIRKEQRLGQSSVGNSVPEAQDIQ